MSADPPRSLKTARDPDPTEAQPGLAIPSSARQQPETAFDGDVPPLPSGGPPYLVPGYAEWQLLGSGTFGEVWRARHAVTTVPFAIKFFVRSAGEVQGEVRRLAQLAHSPGIIHLEGFYPDAPVPYLVMEYADHGSLGDLLPPTTEESGGGRPPGLPVSHGRPGGLPPQQALTFFREIAEALAYVHAKGILHCDLKPANVLLDSRDHVRLADFGQAQLASELRPSLGTYFYMAPEQAQTKPQAPDTRWDVYALGAILFQMLTGRLPRHDAELAGTLQKTANLSERLELYRTRMASRPKPSEHRHVRGVDRDLADLVDRCLELDPEKRFSDASSVLAALRRRDQRRKQRPVLVFGVVGPLLLMSLIVLLSYWQGNEAVNESKEQLTQQRLASDRDVARIVASALQRNLKTRLDRVAVAAQEKTLPEAVTKNDRPAMERLLERELLLGQRGRPSNAFMSAWVTTPAGKILALEQTGPDDNGKLRVRALDPDKEVHVHSEQFTWRDWFSGKGDRKDAMDVQHPMVKGLHVSDPYVGVIPDVGTVVAVSVPIRKGKAEVVGLLTASVRLRTLGDWLKDGARLSDGGEILLLNRSRGGSRMLLLRNGEIIDSADGVSVTFEDLEAALEEAGEGTLRDHVDPDTGKTYLAGYARTMTQPLEGRRSRLDWVVLVRHEKAEALGAVEVLRERTWRFRLLTYGMTGLLMAGLWAWLFWLMRRQDSLKA